MFGLSPFWSVMLLGAYVGGGIMAWIIDARLGTIVIVGGFIVAWIIDARLRQRDFLRWKKEVHDPWWENRKRELERDRQDADLK